MGESFVERGTGLASRHNFLNAIIGRAPLKDKKKTKQIFERLERYSTANAIIFSVHCRLETGI